MVRIRKGLYLKIIIILVCALFLFNARLYSSTICSLRLPLKNYERIGGALSEQELIDLLSGNDVKKIDEIGLTQLDLMKDPEQVARIIEEVFKNRKLCLSCDLGEENNLVYIEIYSTVDFKSLEGRQSFAVLKDTSLLDFRWASIEDVEKHGGKRLFPLLYRWMAANYFFDEFSGWGILAESANHYSARALFRSGFDITITSEDGGKKIRDIKDIVENKRYNIKGTFTTWKGRHLIGKNKKVFYSLREKCEIVSLHVNNIEKYEDQLYRLARDNPFHLDANIIGYSLDIVLKNEGYSYVSIMNGDLVGYIACEETEDSKLHLYSMYIEKYSSRRKGIGEV
ncbi:hypothetical protein ACFL2G_02730, partial [Candidatus Omnitrophota bacterium]